MRHRSSALVAVALLAAALSGPAGAQARAAAPCKLAATEIWLGLGLGGGTAGTTFYPLEFSNIGKTACSLSGYPGVSATTAAGKQLGQPGNRNPGSHATVTLAPGATAHAILAVHDAGAICSKPVSASGLRVFAPGQTGSQEIPFGFQACAKSGVLTVGPVRPGTGIPGYTTT